MGVAKVLKITVTVHFDCIATVLRILTLNS